MAEFIAEARRQLKTSLESVDNTLLTVNDQIQNLGESTTKAIDGLLPVEQNVADAVKTVDTSIKIQSEKIGQTIDSVNNRINDKRIDDFLNFLPSTAGNVDQITKKLTAITGNFEAASKEAPEIAQLWKKMMVTSSRFQKALIISRIIGLVGPLFGPLVP
jgi:hypothetical protein